MKIYESILEYELFKKVSLYKPYGKISTIGGLDKYIRECINCDLNPKPEEAFSFELYSKDIKEVRCLIYLGNWSADFQVYSPEMTNDEEYVQDAVSKILTDNSSSIQEIIDLEKYEAEKEEKLWRSERGVTAGGRARNHKLIEMAITIAIILFSVVVIFANILKAAIE